MREAAAPRSPMRAGAAGRLKGHLRCGLFSRTPRMALAGLRNAAVDGWRVSSPLGGFGHPIRRFRRMRIEAVIAAAYAAS